MGLWYVMYNVYVMYCNVWVGLIIINNTRSKRVNVEYYVTLHIQKMKLLYMPNFMFVEVSVIEFHEFNRKRRS